MWLIPHTNTSSFGRLIGRGIGGEEVVAVSIRMEIDSGQPMMVVFRLWGIRGRIWVVTLFESPHSVNNNIQTFETEHPKSFDKLFVVIKAIKCLG